MKAFTGVFRRRYKAKDGAKPGAVRKLNRKIELLKKRNLKIEHTLRRDNAPKRQRRLEEKLRKNHEKISKLERKADDQEHAGMIADAEEVLKFSAEALKNAQKESSHGYGIMTVIGVQNDLHSKAVQALSSLHRYNSNSYVNKLLPESTESEAKRKLTEAIELLENKSVQIEEEIKTEDRTAKENVLKNRTLARRALK